MVDGKNSAELTDAEAELYDRQIRLWGLESQKRLRFAKVLLIGLNGLGAEIAKNIILAGVKSVTFLDHRELSKLDTCSQFLAPTTSIGQNRAEASLQRAQNLNPMVTVTADSSQLEDKVDSYFMNFDVVCAVECTITQIRRLNIICQKENIKFFVGDVWGMFGYTFADLNIHEFVDDVVQMKKVTAPEGNEMRGKEKFENTVITVKRTETFVPFERILHVKKLPKEAEGYYLMRILLNFREKHGRDPLPSERGSEALQEEADAIIKQYNLGTSIDHLLQNDLYAQISPVCAIVGGVMGQEIIKTVSQKGTPHNNLFVFNPDTMCGKILHLGH